jgi:hypothetical protein
VSNTIRNDAAHPEWRQLCQAAMLELDSAKLLERIAEARTALLSLIEHSPKPSEEQLAMRDALGLLTALQQSTEREVEPG